MALSSFADATRVYDVGDYVQEGLVAHFDGIRNAGADADHVSSGTTWVNLGSLGTSYNATIQSWDSTVLDGEWTDTGYNFNPMYTNTYAAIDAAFDIGTNWTIQLVTTVDPVNQAYDASSGKYEYPSYFNTYDGKNICGIWAYNLNKTQTYIVGNFKEFLGSDFSGASNIDSNKRRLDITSWNGEYATLMLSSEGKGWFFQEGTLPDGATATVNATSPGAKRFSWAGSPYTTAKTPVRGIYHNVRIYTNTLSNAQIVQNRRVDDIRFRGIGDVTIVNGSVGDTGTVGSCGLADGAYNLDEGTWTFTAPEVKVGDKTYRPSLKVETYNSSSDTWTVTSTGLESYTYTSGSDRVRLTWTWRTGGFFLLVR